jgi:hypothetical protein
MAETTDSTDETQERMGAAELANAARESIAALTGHTAESVSGLEWDAENENWVVTVDVLELERIPNTTDVLATYEVRLDGQGGLLGYRRTHRFLRAQTEER